MLGIVLRVRTYVVWVEPPSNLGYFEQQLFPYSHIFCWKVLAFGFLKGLQDDVLNGRSLTYDI